MSWKRRTRTVANLIGGVNGRDRCRRIEVTDVAWGHAARMMATLCFVMPASVAKHGVSAGIGWVSLGGVTRGRCRLLDAGSVRCLSSGRLRQQMALLNSGPSCLGLTHGSGCVAGNPVYAQSRWFMVSSRWREGRKPTEDESNSQPKVQNRYASCFFPFTRHWRVSAGVPEPGVPAFCLNPSMYSRPGLPLPHS